MAAPPARGGSRRAKRSLGTDPRGVPSSSRTAHSRPPRRVAAGPVRCGRNGRPSSRSANGATAVATACCSVTSPASGSAPTQRTRALPAGGKAPPAVSRTVSGEALAVPPASAASSSGSRCGATSPRKRNVRWSFRLFQRPGGWPAKRRSATEPLGCASIATGHERPLRSLTGTSRLRRRENRETSCWHASAPVRSREPQESCPPARRVTGGERDRDLPTVLLVRRPFPRLPEIGDVVRAALRTPRIARARRLTLRLQSGLPARLQPFGWACL